MIHNIELKTEHLHRSFNHSYKPILTVESGDTLQLTTPDIQWGYSKAKGEPKEKLDSREQEEVKGHPIIGPIEIKSAKPDGTRNTYK
ncbi:hypothetical protein [Piscibacillus salipiscarius]|uniref:hypothetical protein n=1 Tax=Piscibacillus salipiscarius TaxID=299480 RepID=UPI0024371EA1|nr:hypothetical protein [Piscibacillus salipiscarius]